MSIEVGAKVTFAKHGDTSLVYTIITREGDDCCLMDPRGRLLPHVPIELLVLAPGDIEVTGAGHLKNAERCWREVDELEAL